MQGKKAFAGQIGLRSSQRNLPIYSSTLVFPILKYESHSAILHLRFSLKGFLLVLTTPYTAHCEAYLKASVRH